MEAEVLQGCTGLSPKAFAASTTHTTVAPAQPGTRSPEPWPKTLNLARMVANIPKGSRLSVCMCACLYFYIYIYTHTYSFFTLYNVVLNAPRL